MDEVLKDALVGGVGISKDGARIAPRDFYKEKPVAKTFWVLEARWQPPHYLYVQKMGSIRTFKWTEDINRALHFERAIDADSILEFCLWGQDPESRSAVSGHGPMPIPVEHSIVAV